MDKHQSFLIFLWYYMFSIKLSKNYFIQMFKIKFPYQNGKLFKLQNNKSINSFSFLIKYPDQYMYTFHINFIIIVKTMTPETPLKNDKLLSLLNKAIHRMENDVWGKRMLKRIKMKPTMFPRWMDRQQDGSKFSYYDSVKEQEGIFRSTSKSESCQLTSQYRKTIRSSNSNHERTESEEKKFKNISLVKDKEHLLRQITARFRKNYHPNNASRSSLDMTQNMDKSTKTIRSYQTQQSQHDGEIKRIRVIQTITKQNTGKNLKMMIKNKFKNRKVNNPQNYE